VPPRLSFVRLPSADQLYAAQLCRANETYSPLLNPSVGTRKPAAGTEELDTITIAESILRTMVARDADSPLSADLVHRFAPFHETLWEKRNLFVPVVGSGLSRSLPSWGELLRALINVLPIEEQKEIDSLLSQKQLLQVAEHLEQSSKVGRAQIASMVAQFYRRPRQPRPAVYDSLVKLPVSHFLTTNYDPWLKNALSSRLREAPRGARV